MTEELERVKELEKIRKELVLIDKEFKGTKILENKDKEWQDYGKFILSIRKRTNTNEEWNGFILNEVKQGNTFSSIVNFINSAKFLDKKPDEFFSDPKVRPGPLTKKEKRSFEGKGIDDYTGIKSYEDNIVYIPSSGTCFYDCIQYITGKSYHNRMKKITNYTDGRELELLELKETINILSYHKPTGKNKKGRWETRSKKWNKNATYIMGFYRFINDRDNKEYAHYIVFKDTNNLPSIEYCKEHTVLYKKSFDSSLFDKQFANWRRHPKPWLNLCTFYDIEAAPHLLKDRVHIETAIGWTYVDFSKGLYGYDYNYQFEEDLNVVKNGLPEEKNILDRSIYDISYNCTDRYMKNINNDRESNENQWAHNGGKYDTIFFMRKKNMKIIRDFPLGARIAKLNIKKDDFVHIYRDSVPFTFCSLRQLCKDYKTKYQKKHYDFDEVTYHDILSQEKCNKLLKYLRNDVLGYAEAMIKLELEYRKSGESIMTLISAPSIIRRIMQKTSPVEKIYVLMNIRARQRQRKSVTGGFRYPATKQPLILPLLEKDSWMYGYGYNCLGNWLIGLDWNGLYPDACRKSSFGVYKGIFINNEDILYKIEKMITDFSYIPIGYGKFIMYVPYMHKPPLVVKSHKIGNYSPTGLIHGHWPICRIMQAVSMGCEIKCIKWLFVHKKHAMYHTKLYNYICGKKEYYSFTGKKGKRMKWKTLGNAGFGSMLLKMSFPNIYYGVKLYDVMSSIELPNGQIRKKVIKHTLTKAPGANGIQLLGVSKNLMDDLSEKMDIVHTGKGVYGNTDSIYIGIDDLNITKEILDGVHKGDSLYINVNEYTLILSNKTGELKNDHGNSLIPNWRFIDMNKYALMFDRLTVEHSGRLSYYEFHWTSISFSVWENHMIKYDKDYINEVYSNTHVNQKFAKRIFKWFCYLTINSYKEDKPFDNKILIEYDEQDIIFWIKKWVSNKENIDMFDINISEFVCLDLFKIYLLIYNSNEKKKNYNTILDSYINTKNPYKQKRKKIQDILYTKKIFKWYCLMKRKKIRQKYLLNKSKNVFGNIKPWVQRWVRTFEGIKIDGQEIDISTFCKSRVFINDYVSKPIHHKSFLDKTYKNKKIPKYKGLKIQNPTHKEWNLRQFPFNIKSMGDLTLVNKFIKTKYDTLYFVVIGKYEKLTLLHNQDIYLLRRAHYIWHMQITNFLGESEEIYYKSYEKLDNMVGKIEKKYTVKKNLKNKEIPWNNLSIVICTGNKYLQSHNKHPKANYYRKLVNNIINIKIKDNNDIIQKIINNKKYKINLNVKDKIKINDNIKDKIIINTKILKRNIYRMCIKKDNLNKNDYNDLEDWIKDNNNIYIGRDMSFYVEGANKSKWSNPFIVKQYGLDDCLRRYQIYIQRSDLIDDIEELRDKILGCWCLEHNKCHADILIDILYNKKDNNNINIKNTACFTGHRPKKLGGYNESIPLIIKIKKQLTIMINKAKENGYKYFISGMAQGVDQWAAEIVLNDIDLKLIVAIPCESQCNNWPHQARQRYLNIIKMNYRYKLISKEYKYGVMQKRNEWMVNNSSLIIGIWDGSDGGTNNCIQYANKIGKNVNIYNI